MPLSALIINVSMLGLCALAVVSAGFVFRQARRRGAVTQSTLSLCMIIFCWAALFLLFGAGDTLTQQPVFLLLWNIGVWVGMITGIVLATLSLLSLSMPGAVPQPASRRSAWASLGLALVFFICLALVLSGKFGDELYNRLSQNLQWMVEDQTSDAEKFAQAGGPPDDFSSSKFHYTVRAKDSGWERWPELFHQTQGADFGLKMGTSGEFLVIPVFFLTDRPNYEIFMESMLRFVKTESEDAWQGEWEAFETGPHEGFVFDFEKKAQAAEMAYKIQLIRDRNFGYLIFGKLPSGAPDARALLQDIHARVEIEADPPDVPDPEKFTDLEKQRHGLLYNAMGREHLKRAEYEKSIEYFKIANKMLRTSPAALGNLIYALMNAKRYDEAYGLLLQHENSLPQADGLKKALMALQAGKGGGEEAAAQWSAAFAQPEAQTGEDPAELIDPDPDKEGTAAAAPSSPEGTGSDSSAITDAASDPGTDAVKPASKKPVTEAFKDLVKKISEAAAVMSTVSGNAFSQDDSVYVAGADTYYELYETGLHYFPEHPLIKRFHQIIAFPKLKDKSVSHLMSFPFRSSMETLVVQEFVIKNSKEEITYRGKPDNYAIVKASGAQRSVSGKDRVLQVVAPEVKAGDRIEITVLGQSLQPISRLSYHEHAFRTDVPAREHLFYVKGAIQKIVSSTEGSLDEQHEGNKIIWRKRIHLDSSQSKSADLPAMVRLAEPAESWNAAGEMFLNRFHDLLLPNAEEAALIRSLASGTRGLEETVALLTRFLNTQMTLFSGPMDSQTVNRTFYTAKEGDSLDFSLFLIRALRSLNQEAHPVLIRTSGKVLKSIPAIRQFDKMLVYCEALEGRKFVDTTNPDGSLSGAAVFKEGFVLDPGNFRFEPVGGDAK